MAAITIDLSKAFESISHNLLLAKLAAYVVTDDALRLLGAFLTERKQYVKIDDTLVRVEICKALSPPGLHLGPLLFNVLLHDVNFSDKLTCNEFISRSNSQQLAKVIPTEFN